MVTELLQKYIWLVQTFIRAGEHGLSLEYITDKWEMRFDSDYSRRTFNNHRAAVEEVFGITIECNRSTNRYFIRYTEDVSDENAENAWLINSFTVNNMLRLSKESRHRIELMCSTENGFELAEEDMKMRGPGDLEGTQQSGLPITLTIASLAKDGIILNAARDCADAVLKEDPTLSLLKNQLLREEMKKDKYQIKDYSKIS